MKHLYISFLIPLLSTNMFGQALDIKAKPKMASNDTLKSFPLIKNDSLKRIEIFQETYNEGVEKYDAGDYAGAIESYNKALTYNDSDPDLYNNLGNANALIGKYTEALESFEKALEIDPKHSLAYSNRAYSKLKTKNYEGAIDDYNKSIELHPNDPNLAYVYCNRGLAKDFLKDYENAIADYTLALEIDSSFALAYLNRGIALSNKKEYEKAKLDLEKALEVNEQFNDVYYYLGNVQFALGEAYEACLSWAKSGETTQRTEPFDKITKHCSK